MRSALVISPIENVLAVNLRYKAKEQDPNWVNNGT